MARMSVAQLKRQYAFDVLTAKQKIAALEFVRTGDRGVAVVAAYDCQDLATARRLSYQVFATSSVLSVLSLYFKPTELAVLLQRRRYTKARRDSHGSK